VFTEPLPINGNLFCTHYFSFKASCHIAPSLKLFRNMRDCNVRIIGGVFLRFIVEIGSGAMIYILSFINIGSGIQKLLKEDTHASHNSYITHPVVHMVKRDRNMRFILSRISVCGYRRGKVCILHLLTPYTHHSELQVIIATPLISTL
jgi:hypothetical protein